ncbi:glycosyltransferase family 4 protein [Lachnospiraceae bacterium 56-18]
MEKRALQLASVASMIDLFNTDNINILRLHGYTVDVATNFKKGSITSQDRVDEYRNELKDQGIGTYQIPIPRSIKKINNIIKSYKLVKKLVEEKEYQIVHCHSPIGGVICRLACKKSRKVFGTKVIYTAHGFHFFAGASKLAWVLYYPVEKWCSKYTDILITINQEDFYNAKKMKAARVEYVPGIGVHTEEIRNTVADRQAIRSELGFSDEDFVFMSTGQISVRKNHELVIRALSKIKDEKIKYLIVGFGEEERLKKLVDELNLKKRVVFAGYRKDVKDVLHAVEAFAFPSRQEGLPVALMEAMAVGLPVVATRIRGNMDLIENGKGGWLVDCDDVDGFAEGMKKVYLSDCQQMGIENIATMQRFDTKNVCKKMEDIYLSLNYIGDKKWR